MFDLEQSINRWRKQMLAAGIKDPATLEELESHLREEIERLVKAGMPEESAFEISAGEIGRPEALNSEFKKVEGLPTKKIGGIAFALGAIIILRIVTERPDAEHLRENEQLTWMVTGIAMVLFGLGSGIFIKSYEPRDVRVWKLVGIAYSLIAAWLSMFPILAFLLVPKFSAATDAADRVLAFAGLAASLLSVFGWRLGKNFLPVVPNRRTRTTIGITCCLSGVIALAFFWMVIAPQLKHFAVVAATWAGTAMAILGGAGYGLAEAARTQTEMNTEEKYV